jgi:hypothetical protein
MSLDDQVCSAKSAGISGRLEGFANDLLKAVKLIDLFMQGYRGPAPALVGHDNDDSPGGPPPE